MTELDISQQRPLQLLFEWSIMAYQLATYYLFVGV
jgi:hypothetical protein